MGDYILEYGKCVCIIRILTWDKHVSNHSLWLTHS